MGVTSGRPSVTGVRQQRLEPQLRRAGGGRAPPYAGSRLAAGTDNNQERRKQNKNKGRRARRMLPRLTTFTTAGDATGADPDARGRQ